MLAGVSFEAKRPNQGLITKPGKPDSEIVGISLNATALLEPVTPSPLTEPARIC